jgi:N-acetylglucosaminyl-diphospho-decaprenol L-rhamnosyltransferase
MSNNSISAPRVTAVVVSYRSRGAISAALASLAPAHAQVLLDCVVVDNASDDGTVDHVRTHHPWVTVVANGVNVGFGSGCNQGIASTHSPHVLLLNPDAVLPLSDLMCLLSFMDRNPRAGMVAPAIRTPTGQWQHAGGAPTPLHLLVQAFRPGWLPSNRIAIHAGSDPFRTDWLCGAVLLLRRSMLEQVGNFDPRFFLYFEETDLCRRAVERGWELWAVGRSVAEHACGSSARTTGRPLVNGCIAEHYFRSRFRYLAKHHGIVSAGVTECAEFMIMSLWSLARVLLGRDIASYRTRMRAPFWGLPLRRRPARSQP